MTLNKRDYQFLERALELAGKGAGHTAPNPLVGAVLVRQGQVVGEGYHRFFGGAHAEIEALRQAGARARGATLYVNLEPCHHQGKTPPCTLALIRAGIKKVFCIQRDPHSVVNGTGLRFLRKNGIPVVIGGPRQTAGQLNAAFFTFHTKKRPLVSLKFAASLDGKIATRTGDSRWITNERARVYARRLRSEHQAILVGVNTVLTDNPHLGARQRGHNDPLRIILDSRLRSPLSSEVFRDQNVLVVSTLRSSAARRKAFEKKGVQLHVMKSSHISLPVLMKELHRRHIISLFVEGGATVLGSFLDARLVDRVYAFQAPILIGGQQARPAFAGRGFARMRDGARLKNVTIKKFGDNQLITGWIRS